MKEGLTLTKRRSTRHPACHLSDLDYADDMTLFVDKIKEAELLLHKVESASRSCGLFLRPSKTKYMIINLSAYDSVHSSGGSQIEKVEDFKYLVPYTPMTSSVEKPRDGQQFTP